MVMCDRLEIWTLGGLTIKRGETSLEGLVSHKAAALLVYLARSGRPQPRPVLANLFWDKGPDARLLNNLRVLLTSLRREVAPYITITRETVAFNQASPHWLDVAVLEESLAAVRLRDYSLCPEDVAGLAEVLALYLGDFLDGLYLHGSRGFEEWLVLERERLRLQTLEALHQLITAMLVLGEYQAGLKYVGHLLQLDPLHEGAHYQKMCLLAASGQRYAALAQYEHYCQLLTDELGVAPATETTTLCEQLRAGKLDPGNWVAIASTPILSVPVSSRPPCPYRGRCLLAKMVDLFSWGRIYSRHG